MKKISLEIIEFLKKYKLLDYEIFPLVNDASDRRYYRLSLGGRSLILMDSSKSIHTLNSFLKVASYLSENKFTVPKVLQADINKGYLILEDLGNDTLDKYLLKNPKSLSTVYRRVVDLVITLSSLPNPAFPEFDNQFFLHELSAFTSWYLPYSSNQLSKKVLADFNICWSKPLEYLALNDLDKVFVHKDMHCGNLLWLPQRSAQKSVGIIDFQSAKSGSFVYDITSLLYDCRFPLSPGIQQNLLDKFLSAKNIDSNVFKNLCDIYIAQRNIKILGNFAYIYKQKNNPAYLKYLPNVWSLIHQSLDNPILKEVKTWFLKNKIQSV